MILRASDNLPSILRSAFSISWTFFQRFFQVSHQDFGCRYRLYEDWRSSCLIFVLSFEDVPRGGLTRSRILYLRVRLSYQTEKCAADLLFEWPREGVIRINACITAAKVGLWVGNNLINRLLCFFVRNLNPGKSKSGSHSHDSQYEWYVTHFELASR